MKIDQYYLECLSQASYLIADEEHGVAAVVDPRRDVEVYLRDAEAAGLRIEYVIETHFHADFLSGHLELAEATGAEIIFGEAASPEYPARLVSDGETIRMGSVELEFLATPGHTPESISVVVRDLSTVEGDERPEPAAVLTGDTLFIGDVGRPDLLASVGVTAEELGASLYDSLHSKLMALPDQTLVYPAHGAGSACGKNLSTETVSTIGEQKRTNYALAPMTPEQFIEVVTDGQPSAPAYFSHAVATNKGGHELLDAAPLERVDLAAAELARSRRRGAARRARLHDVRGRSPERLGQRRPRRSVRRVRGHDHRTRATGSSWSPRPRSRSTRPGCACVASVSTRSSQR